MTGAPKNYPPGEAPEAEARAEAALERELGADIGAARHCARRAARRTVESRARRRGGPRLLAPRAARSRRLSDDRRRGRGALCRKGALDQEAHRRLYDARAPVDAHRPDGGADPLDGVRHHRDRSRGAAARGQSDQAAQAPLQRGAARRQELPVHPDLHGPRSRAAHQASRRALDPGRLFRTVRQRRRGVPHHERAPARFSAAHLLGQLLRQPHPPLPALSDQALLRPLHRRDRARRLRRPGEGGEGLSLRPKPRDPHAASPTR